jgi:hypothetical protein
MLIIPLTLQACYYHRKHGITAEFVRQILKSSSNQYRISNTVRNGGGGMIRTHDRSNALQGIATL